MKISASASLSPSARNSRLALLTAVSLSLGFTLGMPLAHGADINWTASSTDANWITAANWTGAIIPGNTSGGATASTDVAVFNTAVSNNFGGSAAAVVIDTGRTVSGITFNGTAGGYVIGNSGSTLYVSSGGIIQKTGSASNQTVNVALRIMGANATYTIANTYAFSASLAVGSAISGGTVGATTLNLDGTNTSSANRLNGSITNGTSTSVAVVKNGTGAWALVAAGNTFSGGVTVNQGTLNIRNAGALGTGTLTLNGGAIDNNTGAAITNSRNNAQAWNGDFAFTGSSDFNLGTGAVVLNATRTITVGGSTLTVGGAISGTGFGLTKTGAGTLLLSGNNTYTGDTTITTGTVTLGASERIADTSNLALGGGAFATGGFNETLGTLAVTAASSIDFGSGTSGLVFADSHLLNWTGTLTLLNFDVGTDSLKFGSSASSLTQAQLTAISLAGYTASLDGNGGVIFTSAIPEPSTYALLAGGALLVVVASRRIRRSTRRA